MIVLPRSSSAWSALLLFILIPVWVITNAFETGKIERMAAEAGVSDLQVFSNGIYLQVFVVSLLAMGVMYYCWRQSRTGERSEEHTSELQSRGHLVCRLLLEKNKFIRLV